MTTHPKMRDAINVVRLGERFAVFGCAVLDRSDKLYGGNYRDTKDEAIETARLASLITKRPTYVVDRLSAESSPRAWRIDGHFSPVQLRPDEVEALKPRIDWSTCE